MDAGSRQGTPSRGFTALLAALDPAPEQAAAAYEALRGRLSDFFRWKGCPHSDELADRTFDRVAAKLEQGETIVSGDPARYALGVARLIYLETVKKEVRQKKALADAPLVSPTQDDPAAAELRLTALEGCLGGLAPADRGSLLRYHEAEGGARIKGRKGLAEELSISLNTLRIRMHRLRQKVEDCVRHKIVEMDRAPAPLRDEP